eukprot:7415604-Prorocentrum_lima.AAC.1
MATVTHIGEKRLPEDVDRDAPSSCAAVRKSEDFRPQPSGKTARTLSTSREPARSPGAISQPSTPLPLS